PPSPSATAGSSPPGWANSPPARSQVSSTFRTTSPRHPPPTAPRSQTPPPPRIAPRGAPPTSYRLHSPPRPGLRPHNLPKRRGEKRRGAVGVGIHPGVQQRRPAFLERPRDPLRAELPPIIRPLHLGEKEGGE